MLTTYSVFRVLKRGNLSIVGFGSDGMPPHFYYPECLRELVGLVEVEDCQTLGFDLSEVPCLPSGFVGLLNALHKRGVNIRLFNAAEHISCALKAMQLDHVFQIDDVGRADWAEMTT